MRAIRGFCNWRRSSCFEDAVSISHLSYNRRLQAIGDDAHGTHFRLDIAAEVRCVSAINAMAVEAPNSLARRKPESSRFQGNASAGDQKQPAGQMQVDGVDRHFG